MSKFLFLVDISTGKAHKFEVVDHTAGQEPEWFGFDCVGEPIITEEDDNQTLSHIFGSDDLMPQSGGMEPLWDSDGTPILSDEDLEDFVCEDCGCCPVTNCPANENML